MSASPSPGPRFGLRKSGHYFVTNEPGIGVHRFYSDGLSPTTMLIVTEVWPDRNEFYGFGSGADEVTVRALSGSSVPSR